MINYTAFAMIKTSYLMSEEEVANKFPYDGNYEFNMKLSRVMLWCSLLYVFLVPALLSLVHIGYFFLTRNRRGIDWIKMPIILVSIPFCAQFVV
jgi:hypothetical protein